MALPNLPLVKQQLRMVDDSNKYTKVKFIKNDAKEFVRGLDSIKTKNWINNMETIFKAMQVPLRHKTMLVTCILQDEAFNRWDALEKSAFKQ